MRIKMRLDLFQGEKTETATPKKRRDARMKGQVPQSREAGTAVSLLVMMVFMNFYGKFFVEAFFRYFHNIIELLANPEDVFVTRSFMKFSTQTLYFMMIMVGPILGTAMGVGLMVTYMQVGVLFTTKPLVPKLNRINPLSGFKRMFSLRSIMEMVKALSKAGVMIYIAYSYLKKREDIVFNLLDMDLWQMAAVIWKSIFDIAVRNAIFLIAIAFFDYVYNRWDHEKNLKMSKQEIKEEYKQTEGDPLIKSKIKERQRQIAMRRMMEEVPKADVVITNPTHLAIAIRYNNQKDPAPKVLAKGQDLIALNIRKRAEEYKVPVVENKHLARALYQSVQVGDYIPPDLYQAVAEVLAYVYGLKKH